MTSRERLLCVLSGEIPDRVPVSPFVQEEYLSWYWPDRPHVDRVVDATELAEELDFDLMAKHRKFERPHFLKKSFPNWELSESITSADGMRSVRTEIKTPKRTLVQEEVCPEAGTSTVGLHATVRRHLLETEADIESFMEYFPALDKETIDDMKETAAGWKKILGNRGVLAPFGWAGVFNFTAELRGIEALLMDPYDDEPLYDSLMGHMADQQAIYLEAYGQTDIDCIGIQGHMANSRTVGPDFFRKNIQSYEKRMIDAIHSTGCYSVYHNCGWAGSMYDNYRELGMTVWETISEPPQGDNDLAKAKAALGDTLCLLGNLDQINFLKTATPDEVDARTREVIRKGKPGGRYIFSTSDFLERNTPLENVKAMLAAARDEGRY